MKHFFSFLVIVIISSTVFAQNYTVKSPNEQLVVNVFEKANSAFYNVELNGITMLEDSPLGLQTTLGNFSNNITLSKPEYQKVNKSYTQDRIKTANSNYTANQLVVSIVNHEEKEIQVVFNVSNNDIGFQYKLPQFGEAIHCVITKELSGFNFLEGTTTFLSPQATPGIGWKNTKPSYEEEYVADEPIATASKYGLGYTFPALFHVENKGWVLISETGVSSTYCASHLSDSSTDGVYSIAFPHPDENNGIGSANAAVSLPASTPWRTITVGENLKPIVETTIPYDLVEPLYQPSQTYEYGRATWSWILWQDDSMNYDDQVAFIDLAAKMDYEYILIDALWDKNVGYKRLEELISYAQSKNVDAFLWYNSNGFWNNAPQGPRNKMNTVVARKEEMKWLQKIGVKGLKVDFFGGDKQETMKLYEDILSDANDYGLMVIFHGCTLPRGWERMYPNFVGSEAVLASENLVFSQHFNDDEAYNASLHPFIRNAVGAMDFGPVLLNKHRNRANDGGNVRVVSEIFELATGILFQNPIQNFGITPRNLTELPYFEIDFMKNIPTTWDDTVFIDGYPGKYCVLARKHNDTWYVVGVNANKTDLDLKVNVPMLVETTVDFYGDNKDLSAFKKDLKVKKSGTVKLKIRSNGAVILKSK